VGCHRRWSCAQGVAINFVKADDIRVLRDIEQASATATRRRAPPRTAALLQARRERESSQGEFE
jgi:hypothetical protein